MDNKFNFWLPCELEKAENKKGEKVMKIKGIASTPEEDSEGETLLPIGFDLGRFLSIGLLNWNHMGKNDASKIVGEPTVAKITPKGELYVEGVLYNGHPLAESIWQLGETFENNNSKRRLGFSIEGRATERDPINPKRITKALLTGLAITPTPVNMSTFVDLVKGEQKEDFIEYEFSDMDEILKKSESSEFIYTFENNGITYGISKSFGLTELEKSDEEKGKKEKKMAKVMKEWKEGKLKSSSGDVVTDQKQAIAIAMSEAGLSKEKAMDVAATKPLVPESLDGKPKTLEPEIRKAILAGIIPVSMIVDIIKGGEGSRGGKVIGHTKSGKPVYEHSHNVAYHGYTKEEHQEASEHHDREARMAEDALENTKDFNRRKSLKQSLEMHRQHAEGHKNRG